jgi:hypothetical protein
MGCVEKRAYPVREWASGDLSRYPDCPWGAKQDFDGIEHLFRFRYAYVLHRRGGFIGNFQPDEMEMVHALSAPFYGVLFVQDWKEQTPLWEAFVARHNAVEDARQQAEMEALAARNTGDEAKREADEAKREADEAKREAESEAVWQNEERVNGNWARANAVAPDAAKAVELRLGSLVDRGVLDYRTFPMDPAVSYLDAPDFPGKTFNPKSEATYFRKGSPTKGLYLHVWDLPERMPIWEAFMTKTAGRGQR